MDVFEKMGFTEENITELYSKLPCSSHPKQFQNQQHHSLLHENKCWFVYMYKIKTPTTICSCLAIAFNPFKCMFLLFNFLYPTHTRSNISFMVSMYSYDMREPHESNWQNVNCNLCYSRGTILMGISYSRGVKIHILVPLFLFIFRCQLGM